MQPTPVFLPGESHGRRSLVDYSPQGCKELDTTEVTQHACMWCTIQKGLETTATITWVACLEKEISGPFIKMR